MSEPLALSDETSAYLRGLAAALHAAAPASPHPPLHESLALLYALDPAFSGDILYPSSVVLDSGMPGWAWVERAGAEARVAQRAACRAPTPEDPVRRLDPALASRLDARARLHAHLRAHPTLPVQRTTARLVRERPAIEVQILDDRVLSDGRWARTTVVIRGAPGATDLGLARRTGAATVTLAAGVDGLLGRHALSPLTALHGQLAQVARGAIVELARGTIGPLWCRWAGWPPDLSPPPPDALVLHLPLHTLSQAIDGERDHDPFRPAGLPPPPGLGASYERRIAVTPSGEAAARELIGDRLDRAQILGLDPRRLGGR